MRTQVFSTAQSGALVWRLNRCFFFFFFPSLSLSLSLFVRVSLSLGVTVCLSVYLCASLPAPFCVCVAVPLFLPLSFSLFLCRSLHLCVFLCLGPPFFFSFSLSLLCGRYEVNVDAEFGSHGRFRGNPISNAQLFVTKHLKDSKCFTQPPKPSKCRRSEAHKSGPRAPRSCQKFKLGHKADDLHIELNLIRQETLDWAAKGGNYEGADQVICGGDNMFHVNKGAMGIRLDAGDGITVSNVNIDVVENQASAGSRMCSGVRKVRAHPQDSQEL